MGLTFALVTLLAPSVDAQTFRTWDGDKDDDWGDKKNWTGDNEPTSSNEVAKFTTNAAGYTSIQVDRNKDTGGILFDAALTVDLTFTGGGNKLTILNGAANYGIINNSDQTLTFENTFAIEDNMTWTSTHASGGGLIFENTIEIDVFDLTFNTTNSNNVTNVTGEITGAGNILKTGAGTLTLTGVNTYAGNTTLNGGTLTIDGGAERIADGSNLSIANGALFNLAGGNGTETIGSISGAGDIQLNYNNTFITETAADTTFSGSILGSNSTFRKAGTGDLTLTGASTYAGPTLIDGGTLIVAHDAALGTTTANNVIANGATLALDSATGITLNEQSFSVQGTGDGGTGAVRNIAGTNTLALSSNLNFVGATTLTADAGSLTLQANHSVQSDLTVNGAGNVVLDGQMYGGGGVTKDGSGTLTFAGGSSGNSYAGATSVNHGTLILAKNPSTTAIGSNTTLTIGDGSGSAGSAVVQLANDNQIADSTPTVAIASDGRLDLNGHYEAFNQLSGSGQITLGDGEFELGINSGSSTYAGVISGDGDFTKSGGGGTVTLSGANTYLGKTDITGGTLTFGASDVLSNATAVTVSGGATLNVNGKTDTVGSIAGAGNVTLGSGTLTNGGNNTSTEFSGIISGTGNIVQSGTGTLTLSGTNTYSGNTTVNTGSTLILAAHDALGNSGATTVNSGATLALQGNIRDDNQSLVTLGGTGVSSAGAIRNISGVNTLSADVDLSANTTVTANAGTLNFGLESAGDSPYLSKSIDLGGYTLTIDADDSAAVAFRYDITGTGGLTKTGAGDLLLNNGWNTYTGATQINDGKLILSTYYYSASFPANYGLTSDVTIGDNIGTLNSAIFQMGEDGALDPAEYIRDTQNVTVNSDGYWNLQGFKETIANLTLNGGTIDAKEAVDVNERLDVTGVLTANSGALSSTSTINGLLGFAGDTTKSIVVGTGATLDIEASLSNGGFVKTGAGTLELSGGNTFTNTAKIDAGIVRVNNNGGLGSVAGGTKVTATGAQLRLENVTIGAEALELTGTGISNDGALRSESGTNSWAGAVTLTGAAEIETATGSSLLISGGITGGGNTLTVESIGNTTFSGANTFGTLNKTGAGTLTVQTNANAYGTANVSAGTFALGSSNILSNTMDINVDGTGNFNVGTYSETVRDINGNGTLTVASGGELTIDHLGNTGSGFRGTLDIDGVMTLNGGTIGVGAIGTGSTGEMILTAGNTLEIASDFTLAPSAPRAAAINLACSPSVTTPPCCSPARIPPSISAPSTSPAPRSLISPPVKPTP